MTTSVLNSIYTVLQYLTQSCTCILKLILNNWHNVVNCLYCTLIAELGKWAAFLSFAPASLWPIPPQPSGHTVRKVIQISALHSCYIAENRFPFGQCITFMPMRHIFLHLTYSRQRAIKLRTLRQLVQHFCAQVNNLCVKRNGVIYKNRAKKERCMFLCSFLSNVTTI